jgi:acetyl-CoA acetyltransferase
VKFTNAHIPLGFAWSSPFTKWQGSLAGISSLDLAFLVTQKALADRDVEPDHLNGIVLGTTVPQSGAFYGAPHLAARLGAPGITGPMVAQACATSAASMQAAALAVEMSASNDHMELVVTADRTSNGPLLVFPQPSAMGGSPAAESWVLENFRCDPWTGQPMISTAEGVASEAGFTREEIDDLVLLRFGQYQSALAHDRAFQRRYMVAVELPGRKRQPGVVVSEDEGVHAVTGEALARLIPEVKDGVVTFGAQTHPADGSAGAIVTTRSRALGFCSEGTAQILSIATARAGAREMPKAPVPAAERALNDAGITLKDVDVVNTHNPFAVNDLWFNRQTGYPLEKMNLRGSSLVYGHPQAPTGMRLMAEMIEVLRERGGGTGLFTGCAAGDSAMAVVLRVDDQTPGK